MSPELKNFINENIDLINENTKESWEDVYKKIDSKIAGEFTQIILDAGINDPASVLGYIPKYYLNHCNIQSYIIPSNITHITTNAFSSSSKLISVVIPNSVRSIGYKAFQGCSSLAAIVIPDSVISISESAFAWCESLKSVIIPDNVIDIDEYIFNGCKNLKEIQYKGTKKQSLTKLKVKNKRWRAGSAIQKIICDDGIIYL